jgi:hypothetical protein
MIWALATFLWVFWEWLCRIFTGRTALERLCVAVLKLPVAGQASRIRSWILSKVDGPLKQELLNISGDEEVDSLLDRLVAAQKIDKTRTVFRTVVFPVMTNSLAAMREVNSLLAQVEQEIKQPFDQDNSSHEQQLLRLWVLLCPDTKLSARISSDWGEIGFQGTNPATDFRGMGMFGLRNLVSFAELYPREAKAVLRASGAADLKWFPFAITGINLSGDIASWLRAGELHDFMFAYPDKEQALRALFATIFFRFNAYWENANPVNVMAFSAIHARFKAECMQQLRQHTFVLLPLPSTRAAQL